MTKKKFSSHLHINQNVLPAFRSRSQDVCVSKLFSSDRKSQTMPAMRFNRASLMQTKIHQFSTMETSLTLNIGNLLPRTAVCKTASLRCLPSQPFLGKELFSKVGTHMQKCWIVFMLLWKKNQVLSVHLVYF